MRRSAGGFRKDSPSRALIRGQPRARCGRITLMIDAPRATISSASAPARTATTLSPPSRRPRTAAGLAAAGPPGPLGCVPIRLQMRRLSVGHRCNHVEDILPVNAAWVARSFRQMICQSVISGGILGRLGPPARVMTNGCFSPCVDHASGEAGIFTRGNFCGNKPLEGPDAKNWFITVSLLRRRKKKKGNHANEGITYRVPPLEILFFRR